jgi:uroporphyrinogen decarboxylase
MLFDTWAGQLAPADVRRFVLPWVRRIVERVRSTAATRGELPVPVIYYAGEAAGWLEVAAETGADVLGLDWRLPLDAARRRLGPGVTMQGNLDPAVLLGTPAIIRAEVARVLDEARGTPGRGPATGHIFNLGHGILPDTPPAHARLVVDAVRELTEGA